MITPPKIGKGACIQTQFLLKKPQTGEPLQFETVSLSNGVAVENGI